MGHYSYRFCGFPFRTSKLKNDIKYIYVKTCINVCFFVHQVIGVLLRVKTNALVDFHSSTSPQLVSLKPINSSFAECAKVQGAFNVVDNGFHSLQMNKLWICHES
jgi:hypothetical protein